MKKIISPITGKSKYLLIENCEVISDVKISNDLKESLKLSAGKNGTLIVKNLPGTILNRENQNGRIYSTQVLAQAIQEAKPLFETKQLLSQADEHPEGSFVAPSHASHVVTNAYIKKNVNMVVDGESGTYDMLFMDIEVLNTDEGKNLRALLEAECSVGTSIRGVGDMEGKYVKNYEILGIDFVGNPSSSTFTRMPVSESVQVEVKDPRDLKETFTITTSSTNVVRDLEQAAVIQQQLEGIGYGTVTKTSTKVDQETDPKTGAQTSITTLEAETSDDVSDLDQALQMAKNAMLNGTVNVDSITIENVQEEEPKESVEYIPENEMKEFLDFGNTTVNGDNNTVISGDDNENDEDTTVTKTVEKEIHESAIKEAKKDDEDDPNLGKKFILHTDRGFVTFDKNAIDFTDKPEDALHFTQGKEENGMVSMSKVTEILDAMGIFEVKKYFQKNNVNLGGTKEPKAKEEGLIGDVNVNPNINLSTGDMGFLGGQGSIAKQGEDKEPKEEGALGVAGAAAGGLIGGAIGLAMGNPISGATVGGKLGYEIGEGNFPCQIKEENGNDTKFRANVNINDNSGNKTETVNVSATDMEGAQKEVANLWNMKAQTLEGNGTVDIMLVDTATGEQLHYNPQNGLFESGLTEDSDPVEVKDDTVTVQLDDDDSIEKEFDSPVQAKVAASAVEQGKADPKILVPEASEPEMITCAWCKDQHDKVDCKKEKDLGWLCPQCERSLESQGVELEYEDGIDEKLYSNPSEPSDELQKEPLSDSENDILVTLSHIDWDMDAILNDIDSNEPGEIQDVIEALPDPWTIRLNAVDLDKVNSVEELKAMILNAANEQAPWAINNATIEQVNDADTNGKIYDASTEENPVVSDSNIE